MDWSLEDLKDIHAMKENQTAADSSTWGISLNARYGFGDSHDTSLFTSSLPVLSHEKLYGASSQNTPFFDDTTKLKEYAVDANGRDLKDGFDLSHIGDMLPDEDELLSGVTHGFEPGGLLGRSEEFEDYDIFGVGGAFELDSDPIDGITASMANAGLADGFRTNGLNQYGQPGAIGGSIGTVAGEHPYGEHPSRTLFVRNINSNVEDSELRALFEQYGDIRTLYTATKHRGFVMISYFDIRSARTAMRALQNKPLRRRKLDIHFSIPKENPSDKDLNQGTLVIFNLDPAVSNDELRQIFGAYGEVKEIRETPHKKHHKFIEFFDVRAAESALRALNRSEIAGKRIKLEPSRPGGARRNLIMHINHDLDQEDPRIYRPHIGSPAAISPPGAWAHFGSPTDSSPLQTFNKSPGSRGISPIGLPNPLMSNSMKISPIGKDSSRPNLSDQGFSSTSPLATNFQLPRSFRDHGTEIIGSSAGSLSSFAPSNPSTSGTGTLTGQQFFWGSPKSYPEHSEPAGWQTTTLGRPLLSGNQTPGQSLMYGTHQTKILGSADNHHVGSAPSGVPFESHPGLFPESPEASFMNQVKYGNIGGGRSGGSLLMNMAARPTVNHFPPLSGSIADSSSPSYRMPSPRMNPLFPGSALYQGLGPPISFEAALDRQRNRRVDISGLVDSKKQYQLDLDRIRNGEDTRTTLMIKNIPNKYTSNMLLAVINENHKGTYDFFYLPIDFKNKCNVGYAFINMLSPAHIISFYEAFNGKKWEKFNSEKVASLAYGRIQGRNALVSHFQNSSLMNEDKRCRPLLFHSVGPEAGSQEPFPASDSSAHDSNEDGTEVDFDSILWSNVNDLPGGGESR